ncbi:hypothetical protein FJY71_06950, partial [candidate division WOR-3 bacterium]|nr:hypothetical protein [candidate division WOR-3 bacterium]
TPAAIPGLRYLGLVKDPALSALPPDSSVGPGWRLLVVFAADSFSYPTTNMSKRGVFYSHSDDEGANWSEPELLFLSRPEDQTFASLSLARRRYVTYFAWDELSQNGGNPSSKVYCGWFVGTGWVGQRDLGAGRWPHAAALEDSLYLVYSASDSILLFRKGNVTMAEPVWVTNTQVAAPEPVTDPQVCPGLAGRVNLLCCGRYSGRIYRYQSVDGGVTFSRMDDLAASAASMPRLFGEGRDKLLLFKDNTPAPFTRLSAMRTANWGEEWYVPVGVTESTLTLGSYSAAIWGPDTASQATVLYESQGLLRRATTPLWGGTWAEPQTVIDTAGFCYSPLLADVNGSLAAVWFKRGDDNTVWEASDTMHFSRDQSDHGTRMASLIAGWLPYSMVGIAPAVDLIVAKTEFHKSRGNRYYEYNVEEDTYVEALEWAEAAGADIVSTSLGYRGWYRSDQFDGRTAPVSIAASLAAKRGLLICTAMGNRDSSRTPWPRAYIVAPGDADGIITCGGIQRSGLPWRGTGIGPTADGRIKPDFAALSDTVAVAAPDPPTDTSSRIDGSVGTSCATALIAGACALIKEAHPDWNAESIIAALRVTSTRSVPDCTLGYGVPRVDSVFRLYPPDVNVEGVPHDRIEIVFPNPFVPDGYGHERVYFALGLASATPRASISIYTVNGTLIDTIGLAADLLTHPGRYGTDGDVATLDRLGAFWDGRNSDGRPVAAGLYLAVLRT